MTRPAYIEDWFRRKDGSTLGLTNTDFDQLLNQFLKLPSRQLGSQPSFSEIVGVETKEFYYSNVFAFLLDPTGEHGLGGLFLSKLLQFAFPNEQIGDIEEAKVYREYLTDEYKRIDIVCETRDYVIGVENKVFAPLNNPLEAYATCLDNRFPQKKRSLVILSLHKNSHPGKLITYSEYLKLIEADLWARWIDVNPKYEPFIKDFIKQIQVMTTDKKLDKDFVRFCENRYQTMNAFMNKLDEQTEAVHSKVKSIHEILREAFPGDTIEVWNGFVIYRNFETNDGNEVSVDAIMNLIGVEINIWVRNNPKLSQQVLSKYNIADSRNNWSSNRLIVVDSHQLSILTPEREIAERIGEVYQMVQERLI